MTGTKPFRRLRLLAAAACLAWAGAASAQEPRVGVRAGPEGIAPACMALGNHSAAVKNMSDTLVWVDENLQVQPGLAVAWRPLDQSTWEFKLREGVRFHDGSPFTAADVKFSIERIPGAAGPAGGLTLYTRTISGVDVVDDFTIRIGTHGSHAALPQDMTRMFIVSSRIPRGAKTAEFNSGQAAIGTGPFRFVAWTPRGDLVVERVAGHWRGDAPWSRFTLVGISNDAARVAGLLSGRVDFVDYVPVSDIARLKRDRNMAVFQGESIYTFIRCPGMREDMSVPAMRMITDKQGNALPRNPFLDPRVREALSLAIDRQGIVRGVFEGYATPTARLMPNYMFGADPDVPLLPHDAARALLAEAGWGTLTGEAGYALSGFAHCKRPGGRLGPFNASHYCNEALDKIIAAALGTLDAEKRREMFERAQAMAVADRGQTPILTLPTVWAGKSSRTWTPRADEDTLPYFILPRS